MKSKFPRKKKNQGMLTKGISIDEELYQAVVLAAQRDSTNFSQFVRRAIMRDLQGKTVTAQSPQYLGQTDDLIDITEACRILRISVWTARRRSRTPGDPLRLAKSKIGKQKPIHFVRSRIEAIERHQQAA